MCLLNDEGYRAIEGSSRPPLINLTVPSGVLPIKMTTLSISSLDRSRSSVRIVGGRRRQDGDEAEQHGTDCQQAAAGRGWGSVSRPPDGRGEMTVLMTGSSGLIGTALRSFLGGCGHHVRRLRRAVSTSDASTSWNPADRTFTAGAFDGVDAVVHLAGESIAGGRWTAARKARIRESRVTGTRQLCEKLARLDTPPKVLVAASAIGFYGDRGRELLDESAVAGSGFLPEVCHAWEAAATPARERGMRVVHLRIGIVLSPLGGALAQMLRPFKLGAGGVLGAGDQYMSWIALDDLLSIVQHALIDDSVSGPVNAVAPQAVTNREFTKTLGAVLRRPTCLPAPAFALRLAVGEMADALLLASTRVDPAVLRTAGFKFAFPDLEDALRHVLARG